MSERDSFLAAHHHVRGERLTFNYIVYGAEVFIDPGELGDFYLIQMPYSGSATIKSGNKEFLSTPDNPSLFNPGVPSRMQWAHGCAQRVLQIPRSFAVDYAEQVLDRKLGPVIFDPEVKASAVESMKWMTISNALFDVADGMPSDAKPMATLEDETQIVDLLLQAQPSNVSAFFEQPLADVGQAYVRRADDFIRANCDLPVTLLDISEAAGVSGRALQLAYQKRFGRTPMHALALERLRRVRSELMVSRDTQSVTDIALKWGFNHLGRFSAAYRQQFGEYPKETMDKSLRRLSTTVSHFG